MFSFRKSPDEAFASAKREESDSSVIDPETEGSIKPFTAEYTATFGKTSNWLLLVTSIRRLNMYERDKPKINSISFKKPTYRQFDLNLIFVKDLIIAKPIHGFS